MSRSRLSGSNKYYAPIAALVAALALAACEGPQGQKGDPGNDGAQGPTGPAAVDHGIIAGTLTVAGATTKAAGVSVTADPGGAATSTDSTGAYSLSLPIGFYTVTFGADANDGFDKLVVQDVAVTAGFSTDVSKALTPTNPLVVNVGPVLYQVGFGTTVQLSATVPAGVPAGVTPTFSWTQVGGPTAALSDATISNPTFTTAKLGDVIGTSATDIPASFRHAVVPIASQQVTQLAYKYKVTVTAGGFTKTATAEVRPITWSTANATFPVGQRIVLGAPEQASYAWSITSRPSSSNAALDYPSDRYASFVPDQEGVYLVAEAARATPLRIVASRYQGTGMYSAAGTPEATTCTAGCHYASATIAKFQPIVDAWKASGHAHHFENGINGVLGTGYSASCIRCHTTGYDPGAVNGGWDDVATQNEWAFPTTVATGKWDTVPWQVKNFSNINCENCHGPAAQHVANFDKTMVSKPYSARVCMTCHYDGTHHDRGFLWTRSPHSDPAYALKGLDASGNPNGHCGRCHTAQGFKLYVNNLKQGIFGNLTGITGLYDATNVEPVTCQACHDPHTLEVRIEENIPMLPAGFGVAGVGKGAICMACHNTRNGAHGDGVAMASLSAPHAPAQTDLLMGKNAYFLSGVNVSAHAAATNTCVTCHVDAAVEGVAGLPDTYHMGGTNHTFEVNETVCANCHTTNVNGVALQEAVEAGIGDLAKAIGKKAYAMVNAEITANGRITAVAYDEATDLYSKAGMDVAVTAAEWPADSSSFSPLPEIHGQMSQCWTLKAPVTVTWSNDTTSSVTRLCYQIKDVKKADGTYLFLKDSVLAKSEWNYYLVHGDGSRGIHNPTFVKAIINTTIAQVSLP